MIKNILIACAFICTLSSTASAQFSAGLGLFYGFDIEEIGIQARGIYAFDETWRGAVDLVFYLDGEDDVSFWETNFNAHYIYFTNEKVIVYAIGGINVFTFNIDIAGEDFNDSEFGLNLGTGGQISISEVIDIIGELKFTISDADQLSFGVGALYSF